MPDYNVTIGMVYQVDGWTGNRSISGYTNSKNGYILIASPVGTVSPEDVTYMLDNDYDLYTFDQAKNWNGATTKPVILTSNQARAISTPTVGMSL